MSVLIHTQNKCVFRIASGPGRGLYRLNACHVSQTPEFIPQNPCEGRREPAPESDLHMHSMTCMHTHITIHDHDDDDGDDEDKKHNLVLKSTNKQNQDSKLSHCPGKVPGSYTTVKVKLPAPPPPPQDL